MKKFQREERRLTPQQQLELWVAGKSIHNSARQECCPDFSCCDPSIKTPLEVREKFRDADEGTRFSMLAGFLAGMFRTKGHRVATSRRC